MLAHFDAGFDTFDLSDHYGPAEDFIGEFRRRLRKERGEEALGRLRAFTKWVPRPGPMTRAIVEQAIDTSLRRMDTSALDLLQFHWWDYEDPRYLDALGHLADLRESGKIRHLALTNFDTEHLESILDRGIRDRLEPGAVFARRPPPGGGDEQPLSATERLPSHLRDVRGRLVRGAIPRAPRARARRARPPPRSRSTSE